MEPLHGTEQLYAPYFVLVTGFIGGICQGGEEKLFQFRCCHSNYLCRREGADTAVAKQKTRRKVAAESSEVAAESSEVAAESSEVAAESSEVAAESSEAAVGGRVLMMASVSAAINCSIRSFSYCY